MATEISRFVCLPVFESSFFKSDPYTFPAIIECCYGQDSVSISSYS